ncbi:hypothetical protein ACPOL_4005 [Acidisarcina polymorpha]|uniref:Oar protein n=1 Tax=Acidisarcina polymorpha TaxID=2211140 RepID=A0A2Z5G397_9BACT|nr:hypothetical protein [Acidisarcina polymorpha]AXC13284.1 hypothetical protein ACPOL_4005 [Acidisarcina polymorpha]
MKKTGWIPCLYQQSAPALAERLASTIGIVAFATLLMAADFASAQSPAPFAQITTPTAQPVAPKGYSLHETIDLGGHIVNTSGSGAMYNTLVNVQSGPRVLGETFELHALPGTRHTLVDSLSAFSNGFGGDPTNFAKMDFSKGKVYEFSGLFRRHRDYFDYNLLGNPNLPSGLSVPIGPSNAPTGSLAWPQVEQSPFFANTVHHMLDTGVTIFPLSKVSFRVGYSQNVMQGPTLSPTSGNNFFDPSVGANDQLLQQYQRNSSDDFLAEIDWKPIRDTRLTFAEEIEHIKENTYFTLAPSNFLAQGANGTAVAPGDWDSFTPYGIGSCNTTSMGSAYTNATTYTILSPQSPGGLPVINPACNVASSYLRSQPTRILYPTEIFRLQSSSIKNIAMNGDARYTQANMNLPDYYENFQGLDGTIRSITFTGNANAKRKVMAVDYGIVWDATPAVHFSDQIEYSNEQQPGSANISKGATANTPATAGDETINYAGALIPGSPVNVEGSPNGVPLPDYFGQKFLTNDLTATWDGWSRVSFSFTYRYRLHIIAQGLPHDTPLPVGQDSNGTVTIHGNGGLFNVALRPADHWTVNGSIEALYNDNSFTPLSPRQLQHYRLHTMYRPKPWITLSGVFNDLERQNNTNNNQAAVAAGDVPYAGPIGHVDHSRLVNVGAALTPNARYGFDFNYGYSGIYASTNICYDAQASPAFPGAASPSGTACPGATVRGTTYYEFGPVKDFMSTPTQYGSFALVLFPLRSLRSSIGYTASSVDGSRFFNDARDVNGSLVSTYHSPFANLAWTFHERWIWRAEYKYFGYGEGGVSGSAFCSISNPTPTAPAPVVPCDSATLGGAQTGLSISPAGETAPRNFHANNVTLGMHYEF